MSCAYSTIEFLQLQGHVQEKTVINLVFDTFQSLSICYPRVEMTKIKLELLFQQMSSPEYCEIRIKLSYLMWSTD